MLKRILRWSILGGTLFFLAKALKDNWYSVMSIRIDEAGWAILSIATGVTLFAHTWAGLVWTWILKELKAPVPTLSFMQVYLKTNIAKYLPGNVWHYWGRIVEAKNAQIPTAIAVLSVLLEPLLMVAAAAVVIVLFGYQFTVLTTSVGLQILQVVGLVIVLLAFHPRLLNPALNRLKKLKFKKTETKIHSETYSETASETSSELEMNLNLQHYPWKPLLGELTFLVLRASGFILTIFALAPLQPHQIPLLLGAFSLAWLLGLIVPGAPGGLGVFEATSIFLLQHHFPSALIISAVGLYRLVSIIAETTGAALAWLDERLTITLDL
ncbi:MAG: flippase-like domain-containing protein [Calothrix sp. C42_A2020_038]|nr:flippase-like domain-containing protein [Calothrix sp. C42_A2020_038]